MALNRPPGLLPGQLRFFPSWSTRRWFEVLWTIALLAALIVVEIRIATSKDDFLSGTLEAWTLVAAIVVWPIGLFMIWLVARCVQYFQGFRSS